ncbi:flippase [Sphingobacterium sp.]|uniref:flippase n=1 Tax=Sphingobacterium sp. TaxID=341027 RepID=UPI0028992CF7|nr:flippase [Sphingobacterium sp.]
MIKEALSKFKNNKDAKRLSGNFLFLFIINVSNFIFPLITFPYLIRVLGIEGFGIINFALAFVVYFTLVSEYGFNLTATRDISLNRDNQYKINEIFSKVIYSKIVLASLCFIVFCAGVLFIPKIKVNSDIFFLTYLSVFAQVFIPIWLFQGLEKMKMLSLLFFISKLFSTGLIFSLVRVSGDIVKVPLINFASFTFISVISLTLCYKKYQIRFVNVSLSSLIQYCKDGFHIFLSNLSVAFFSTGTITILGIMTNNTIVGYFSAADKIIQAIRTLLNTLSQILFPYLSKFANENPNKVYSINSRLIKFGIPIMTIFTLFLILFSADLLRFLTKTNNEISNTVMRIMSVIPLISYTHIILAMFILLVFKKNKDYSFITLTSGLLNLVTSIPMIYFFGAIGAAINIVLIEICSAILYVRAIKHNNLQIFP